MILSIFLCAQLVQPKPILISEFNEMIVVEGSVKIISGNQMPNFDSFTNKVSSKTPDQIVAALNAVDPSLNLVFSYDPLKHKISVKNNNIL